MPANAADTAFIQIATALVLFMTLPGLAIFFGGLVLVGHWTVAATWVLIKLPARITPLRVDTETKANGLDQSAHCERAYEMNS
jgi:Amt family ammonium transporter